MKERPITMLLAWASLGVAVQHLKDLQLDDETANSLLLELETAAKILRRTTKEIKKAIIRGFIF